VNWKRPVAFALAVGAVLLAFGMPYEPVVILIWSAIGIIPFVLGRYALLVETVLYALGILYIRVVGDGSEWWLPVALWSAFVVPGLAIGALSMGIRFFMEDL
jgi:hypothetical protein